MPDETNPNGRPTKLTEEFIGAMMGVINSDDNALIYTDEELIFLINEQLPVEGRIHPDTFSLLKNGKIADDVRAQKFFSVYKRALLKQSATSSARSTIRRTTAGRRTPGRSSGNSRTGIRQKIAITKGEEDGAAALAAALLGQNDAGVDPLPNPTATGTNAPADA